MKLFSALIIAIACLAATTTDLLVPGKQSFEKKWIKDTQYEMNWYALKDTVKIDIGKVSVQIQTSTKLLTAITRVQLKNMPAPWIDSTLADLETLRPVYHSSYNMQRDMVLRFEKIVTGFYHDKLKQKNTVIADTINQLYFDSNLYPFLLAWLPLKEGYQKDISIYDYRPGAKTGLLKASVREVKSDSYQSKKSGTRKVWVVSVADELGSGAGTVYYFDKEDRRLWKQEIDAGGRKMMMQRAE